MKFSTLVAACAAPLAIAAPLKLSDRAVQDATVLLREKCLQSQSAYVLLGNLKVTCLDNAASVEKRNEDGVETVDTVWGREYEG